MGAWFSFKVEKPLSQTRILYVMPFSAAQKARSNESILDRQAGLCVRLLSGWCPAGATYLPYQRGSIPPSSLPWSQGWNGSARRLGCFGSSEEKSRSLSSCLIPRRGRLSFSILQSLNTKLMVVFDWMDQQPSMAFV